MAGAAGRQMHQPGGVQHARNSSQLAVRPQSDASGDERTSYRKPRAALFSRRIMR